jgi:hypothetical protein
MITVDGMQIDFILAQFAKADLQMRHNRDSRANVTVSRRLQLLKQESQRMITVDGMQIDCSKAQSAKAYSQMRHNCDSGSKTTEEMDFWQMKHDSESSRISDRIKISEARPKYQKIESSSTFSRKFPSATKTVFPGSTVIIWIFVLNSAEISNLCSDAGIEK